MQKLWLGLILSILVCGCITAEKNDETTNEIYIFELNKGKWIYSTGTAKNIITSQLFTFHDYYHFDENNHVFQIDLDGPPSEIDSASTFNVSRGVWKIEEDGSMVLNFNSRTKIYSIPTDSILVDWDGRAFSSSIDMNIVNDTTMVLIESSMFGKDVDSSLITFVEPIFDITFLASTIVVDKEDYKDSLICNGFFGNEDYFPLIDSVKYTFHNGNFMEVTTPDCDSNCIYNIDAEKVYSGSYKYVDGDLYNGSQLFLPKELSIGKTWYFNDVQFEVKSFYEKRSTPYCDYKDLLQINYSREFGTDVDLFFKKGLGIVKQESRNLGVYDEEILVELTPFIRK